MNWDQVAGNWKQFTGKVKSQESAIFSLVMSKGNMGSQKRKPKSRSRTGRSFIVDRWFHFMILT